MDPWPRCGSGSTPLTSTGGKNGAPSGMDKSMSWDWKIDTWTPIDDRVLIMVSIPYMDALKRRKRYSPLEIQKGTGVRGHEDWGGILQGHKYIYIPMDPHTF